MISTRIMVIKVHIRMSQRDPCRSHSMWPEKRWRHATNARIQGMCRRDGARENEIEREWAKQQNSIQATKAKTNADALKWFSKSDFSGTADKPKIHWTHPNWYVHKTVLFHSHNEWYFSSSSSRANSQASKPRGSKQQKGVEKSGISAAIYR